MRPQKFSARADYRRQESQRIQESVSLAEKFQELKSLTVELGYFNAEGATKMSEIKCTFNPDNTKSVVRFDCYNHECVGGDFDLSEALAQAVAQGRTTVAGEMCCQGWLSKTTIGEVHCHNILRYKLRLAYGKRVSVGIIPLQAVLTQVASNSGRSNGPERMDARPQMNPFAKAQREGKPEKQSKLL